MAFRQKTADADPLAAFLEEPADGKGSTPAKPPSQWPHGWRRLATMALLLIIGLASGGWLAMRSWSAAPQLGTVTISTTPAGAEVLVGGVSRGQSPVTFTVVPGRNSMVVVNGTQKIPVDFTVAAGGSVAQHVVFAAAEPTVVATVPPPAPATPKPAVDKPAADKAADQRIAAGWVSVVSPMSLRILESGQVIGSSELARVMLPAGSHDVELVNDELGFRERRRLTITLGKSTVINVEPPKVPLNINAMPWAEVSVDGRAVGETPIGNYPVGIGVHTITFRHPDFGERQQRVTVGLKSPARVTIDMKKQ